MGETLRELTPHGKLAWIAKRLAEGVQLPVPETLRNSGARRTPEKREMLRRLSEHAEARGQKPWPANY